MNTGALFSDECKKPGKQSSEQLRLLKEIGSRARPRQSHVDCRGQLAPDATHANDHSTALLVNPMLIIKIEYCKAMKKMLHYTLQTGELWRVALGKSLAGLDLELSPKTDRAFGANSCTYGYNRHTNKIATRIK